MKDRNINMTQGSPLKCIISFCLPLMLGNILQQLYVFFDTMIVGKYIGLEALAALGATEWLIFIIVSGSQGITHGFSIDMSHNIGKKDYKSLRQSIFHSLVMSAIMSLVIGLLGINFCADLLKFLNTPAEIITLASQYLRIIYGGLIISVLYNLSAAVLRAMGDSVSPLKALILSSGINILLDYILVVYLHKGVAGAAYATIFSQLFSLLYCMIAIKQYKDLRLKNEQMKIDRKICFHLLKLGLPLGMQNVIIGCGGIIVQSVINGFGTIFIAAFTAANKLYGLLEIAASSLGSTMATYTGQNIGAKNISRVRNGLKTSMILGIILAYMMSLIMIFGGKFILGCFISSDIYITTQAIEIGYKFLQILSVFFPLLYLLYIFYASLQGMGYTVLSMISSIAQLVMRVLCALYLTRIIGFDGVFWGEIFAWIGSDTILVMGIVMAIKKFEKDFTVIGKRGL